MRHGAPYLIIRDVNLLNHRAVNDWMSLIKRSFRCLRTYMRGYSYQLSFRGFFQLPRVAPYDVSGDLVMRALCKECGLLPAALSHPWFRPRHMICMCDVVASAPHVPFVYINPFLLATFNNASNFSIKQNFDQDLKPNTSPSTSIRTFI